MKKRASLNDLDFGPLQAFQERKSLGEHVFESLKQAIIRGKISANEWLVESHIAETLGISRTPVREAIHKLEREGLIERQPRGGFTVLGLNRNDIEETFGLRSLLEGYAARLAAVKHKPFELKSLEKKSDQIYRYREMILKEQEFASTSNLDHKKMLKYIRKRDAKGAERAVKDHILRGQEMVLKEYDKQRLDQAEQVLRND
ncbi:MAG: GntR family transcriptional regulator [Desulfobacterales bacterium]